MATEELFISVVIILVATRILGEFSQRFRMPPLVGELAAGIIIGPYVLKLVTPSASLNVISDLAVFFLMLLAGLQMDPREIRKAGLRAGILSAIAFSLNETSGVPVNIMEQTINTIIKVSLFIGGIFLVDILFRKAKFWFQRRGAYFFEKLQTKEAAFGILLISTILVSVIAQVVIGLHFIIGTFFSGLIVYKEIIRKENFERVYGIISAITFGFFAPIFFAVIGININMDSIVHNIPLFIILGIVAVVTKVGGGYIGSRLIKFSKDESLAIAFIMNGRGMVELV